MQIGQKWWGLSAARMYDFTTGRFAQRDQFEISSRVASNSDSNALGVFANTIFESLRSYIYAQPMFGISSDDEGNILSALIASDIEPREQLNSIHGEQQILLDDTSADNIYIYTRRNIIDVVDPEGLLSISSLHTPHAAALDPRTLALLGLAVAGAGILSTAGQSITCRPPSIELPDWRKAWDQIKRFFRRKWKERRKRDYCATCNCKDSAGNVFGPSKQWWIRNSSDCKRACKDTDWSKFGLKPATMYWCQKSKRGWANV